MTEQTYKLLIFLKRRPGMSRAAFRDYYENRHVPLILKYGTSASRYVRRYIETMPDPVTGQPQELDFDVITELSFGDRENFENVLAHAGKGVLPADIIADEEQVFDRSEVETVLPR